MHMQTVILIRREMFASQDLGDRRKNGQMDRQTDRPPSRQIDTSL